MILLGAAVNSAAVAAGGGLSGWASLFLKERTTAVRTSANNSRPIAAAARNSHFRRASISQGQDSLGRSVLFFRTGSFTGSSVTSAPQRRHFVAPGSRFAPQLRQIPII